MEVQVKLVPSGVDEDGEEQFMELDEAIINTLTPLLESAVRKKVDQITDTIIREIVLEHVGKLSTEAFSEVFQKTDHWGRKEGDPLSLAEIVGGKVTAYLGTTVGDRGEEDYRGKPRLQYMVDKVIGEAVRGEIGERLKTLRAEFAKQVADKIANVKVS